MDRDRELLKGNTPTLIMAVLRPGPLHGYAIARAIEDQSGSALRCKEGTLYPALQALEREGLIQGEWEPGERGRMRKVYALTPDGHGKLEEERRTWERFAAGINRVLGPLSEEDHAASPPEHPTPGLLPRALPQS